MCLRTKTSCQAPMGKLHPLPIPEDRWSMVLVDFILELPDVHGYNAIMVVDNVWEESTFHPHHYHLLCPGCCQLVLQECLEAPGMEGGH